MTDETKIKEAADRLRSAASTGRPCPPVRDLIGATDAQAAYAVQQHLGRERIGAGARVVGRKIGLTSEAVQRQLGVGQPDFGALYDDMDVSARSTIPMAGLLQPRIEAEIAFVLGTDLAEGPLTPERVRAAVATAVAAFEIVDSRIEDWDISFADTVADNASAGLFVLGERHVTLDEFEPVDATMEFTVADAVVSKGSGAACLGDPLNALGWLARTARELGEPLQAGQVILSGALGPMVPVTPGLEARAWISGLGEITATFGEAP